MVRGLFVALYLVEVAFVVPSKHYLPLRNTLFRGEAINLTPFGALIVFLTIYVAQGQEVVW